MSPGAPRIPPSAWSALRLPIFRGLWFASLAVNIGTWIQDVGTVWLMTSLAPSPIMVSLSQTAMNLPFLLLALPAGALADVMDRRRVLLFAQVWMFSAAGTLGVLTLLEVTTPWILLALTFAIGMGAAVNASAYQALTPEIVPKAQLAVAISLSSVAVNLARAIGPALGGFLVALAGSGAAFLANAATFLGMIGVLSSWERLPKKTTLPVERLFGAMRAGTRFIRHAPLLQAVLIRAAAFVLCASAFWALMPVVVRFEMNLGPGHYGVLLACFGIGAVVATTALPQLRIKFSTDALVIAATAVFAALLLVLSVMREFAVIGAALLFGGAAWLTVLASLNASAQAVVPGWVRGRALAVYLLVFFGGMAGGSLFWGAVASLVGVRTALVLAAVALGMGLLTGLKHRLGNTEKLDLTPSMHWPVPVFLETGEREQAPVVVTVEYRIDPSKKAEFVERIQALREIRLRDGAVQWELLSDTADPARHLEMFVLDSWTDHLRQHERVTVTDREIEERVRAFHTGTTAPVVTHFLTEVPSQGSGGAL